MDDDLRDDQLFIRFRSTNPIRRRVRPNPTPQDIANFLSALEVILSSQSPRGDVLDEEDRPLEIDDVAAPRTISLRVVAARTGSFEMIVEAYAAWADAAGGALAWAGKQEIVQGLSAIIGILGGTAAGTKTLVEYFRRIKEEDVPGARDEAGRMDEADRATVNLLNASIGPGRVVELRWEGESASLSGDVIASSVEGRNRYPVAAAAYVIRTPAPWLEIAGVMGHGFASITDTVFLDARHKSFAERDGRFPKTLRGCRLFGSIQRDPIDLSLFQISRIMFADHPRLGVFYERTDDALPA